MTKTVKPAQTGIEEGQDTSSEILLAQHAAGLKAFNELYERYGTSFYKKAALTLKNYPSSEEAIKTVLSELWKRINQRAASFEPRGDGSFERWAITILGNLCVDELRIKRPEVSIDEKPSEVDRVSQTQFSASEMADPFLKVQIVKALDTLPETHRVVFCLKMIYDFTHEEVARILGIPEGTVKSRLNTACKRVKEYLQNNSKP